MSSQLTVANKGTSGADAVDVVAAAPPTREATRRQWASRAVTLVLATTIVRVLVSAASHISDTEAYYVGWARWPALSYYDHPPLVAWAQWVALQFGRDELVMRLVPIAGSAAFGLLLYRFAARMFSPRAGFFALAIVTALPTFIVASLIINPEELLSPIWVLLLGALYNLRDHDEPWRPLVFGLLVGLGFLAKYTAVLALPLGLAWLATSKDTRRWLRRPSLYASGLVALALATPVIVWNAQRGFPTLQLHWVERAARPSLATYASNALHAAAGQVIFHPIALPGFVVTAVVLILRGRRDPRYRFLAWMALPTLAFFFTMMVRVKDAEPHWTMVAYVPLAIGLGALVDETMHWRAIRVYLGFLLGSSIVGLAFYLVHVESPVFIRHLPDSFYNPNGDRVNETLGWDHVVPEVESLARSLGPGAVVAGDHNVFCGRLEFALDDSPHVYCASPNRTEFDFVGRGSVPPDAPVVFVDTQHERRDVSDAFPGRDCKVADRIDVFRGGHTIRRFRLWTCAAERETHTNGQAKQ